MDIQDMYRGQKKPTDVLSFATLEGVSITKADNDIGDIFLCVPYIRKQALRFDVSYKQECTRMLIHGLLHLLGHDHIAPVQAKKMFGLQERLLSHYDDIS